MRIINFLFAITLCVISTKLFAQDKQDEIIAVWDTGEHKVEIYKVDESFIGNPINPEGERNQEFEILNLKYKKGEWVGVIYSKKRNKSLDVVCLVKEDKLLLEVKARYISRDLAWTRVN